MPNSDYIIRGIPAMLVERMWPFAEPYVKRALDHSAGEIRPEDLRRGCQARDCQLWLVSQGNRVVGAATTEILVYPQKKHCRVITVAGSASDKWENDLFIMLSTWAVAEGCVGMEAHVRKGMVQRLTPFGFKHLHSVVYKKLDIINESEGAQGEDHGEGKLGQLAAASHDTERR